MKSANNLRKLPEVHLAESQSLLHALLACTEKISKLRGFMECALPFFTEPEQKLLQLAELRHSFALEDYNISFTRLFEAYTSENYLNDKTALSIFEALNSLEPNYLVEEDKSLTISSIRPQYLSNLFKTQNFTRTYEKEHTPYMLKAFNIYSPPEDAAILENLKTDFNQNIDEDISFNPLADICLAHYQLRAIAPFTRFNGHCARVFTLRQLMQQGLCVFGALPLSYHISINKEPYDILLKDTTESGNYQPWVLYMLEIITAAATDYLSVVKRLMELKRQTSDQVSKYTAYNMPAETLIPVLFASPFLKAADIIEATGCHRQTAYTILKHLVRMGILSEKESGREKLYFHKKLSDALSF